MLALSLACAVIAFAALVLAVSSGSAVGAWVCVVSALVGVVCFIVDHLRRRRP